MALALAYRPVTGPDDPFDRINDQVLTILEQGQVPWASPWRLVVTPGYGSRNEDVSGIKLCHSDPGVPARLADATNPIAPRDIDAKFHELFAATGINFRRGAIRTFYSLSEDMIALSDWRSSDPTDFLRDWVHELLHAVGHPSRLDRNLPRGFGSNAHGIEDLIAEIGSAFVCASLGIEPSLRHPDSIDTWVGLLRSDNRIFVQAVRSADTAADYLFARRDAQSLDLVSPRKLWISHIFEPNCLAFARRDMAWREGVGQTAATKEGRCAATSKVKFSTSEPES